MHPLSGIRVIECGVAIAGPLCARYLANLGAEVIKVDSRTTSLGAATPWWAPKDLGPAGADLAPGSTLNGEKLSAGLDLKSPEVRPYFERLIAGSDVFVTNMSVPAIESLGLTYATLSALNPRLVHVTLPGFGSAPGPYRDFRSWGPNLSSLSGIDYLTGDPDRDPVMTPLPLPDYVGAYHAAVAILAALTRRTVSGEGAAIELAQFETTINVLGPQIVESQQAGVVPNRNGNRDAGAAPRDVFPSRGVDRWLALEVASDGEWQALCGVEGMPPALADARFATLAGRRANEDALYDLLAAWTARSTNVEAAARLQAVGIAANPVQTGWDHLTDPQLEARGFWRLVSHDRLGQDLSSAVPIRLGATPARHTRAAPSFGHDTRRVLVDFAGADDAAVTSLAERGLVECEAPIPGQYADLPLERPSRLWAWPLLRAAEHADEPVPEPPQRPAPGGVAGLRVLDLSDRAAAYGSHLLALLGADVIRVATPGDGADALPAFLEAGKRRIAIDLATDAGRERFLALAAEADLVYESLPPGTLARLGLDWGTLHARNPRLSLVSVTPFGQSGPYRERKLGGLGSWALSGMLALTGYPDRRPLIPGGALDANLIGATGAIGALSAIFARTATDEGQQVDISAHEVMVFTCSGMLGQVEDMAERFRTGVRSLSSAPYGYFRCRDRLISLLALFPAHWSALSAWIVEKTGNEAALDPKLTGSGVSRQRFVTEVEALVNSLTETYDADPFCVEAQARGIPAMPVNSVAELLSDAHLAATGFWRDVTLPSGEQVKWPGPPFRMDGLVELAVDGLVELTVDSADPNGAGEAGWRRRE